MSLTQRFDFSIQITILLGLLVFTLPLLYFEPLQTPSSLPRYTLIAIVSGSGLLLLSIYIWRDRYQPNWHSTQIIAVLYLFWAAISINWSVDFGSYVIESIQLTGFVILFVLATQISNTKYVLWIIAASVLAAGIAAYIGILQHFGYNPLEYRTFVMGSTFHYKNHAALYFDLIIPVSFFLILASNNTFIKWIAVISMALCLGFVLESRTRGSWLALLVAITLCISLWVLNKNFRSLFNKKLRMNLVPLFVALIIAAAIIVPPGKNDIVWKRDAQAGQKLDQSSSDRLLFYKNSLGLVRDNPVLGVGYGTFWKAFRPYMNYPHVIQRSDENIYLYRLHNDPLQILVELGIIGFVIAISFFISIGYIGLRLVIHNKDEKQTLLAAGLITAFIASIVHSFVDFPLHKPVSAAHIWLWAGLLVSLHIANTANKYKFTPGKLYKIFVLVFSCAYLVSSVLFYRAYLKDNHYLYLAENNIKKADCHKALANIEKAVASFNLHFVTHVTRVNIHTRCNRDTATLLKVINIELEYDDTNIRALLTRGEIYLRAGQTELAKKDFLKIINILPHRSRGKIGLAKVFVAQKQTASAIKLLEQVIEMDPDNQYVIKMIDRLKNAR
mgnify:CR=1 FL=1